MLVPHRIHMAPALPLAATATALLLCGSHSQPTSVSSSAQQFYSSNAICRQNNCINPVFPGLEDLTRLAAHTWQCQPRSLALPSLRFCRDAVNYDIAVVSPNTTVTLDALIATQDDAAATMYNYHLAGLGREGWDNRNPSTSQDDCVKATWRMVCHTYFPKAEAGCQAGSRSNFMRPCRNVCENYVSACAVQCCDESTQCVFEHSMTESDGTQLTQIGYYDEMGPAAACTGASRRLSSGLWLWGFLALASGLFGSSRSSQGASTSSAATRFQSQSRSRSLVPRAALAGLLLALGISLQGCEPAGHPVAEWETRSSYITNFKFTGPTHPGAPAALPVLNSCDVVGIAPRLQCNGNGVCRSWNNTEAASGALPGFTTPVGQAPVSLGITFCECYRDFADPECRTARKSQLKAFLLSLFLGPFGVDHFYIGEYYSGFGKLSTLGGLGLWWIFDVVRIGSSPIYADNFRLAPDLAHWVYVVLSTSFFAAMGYLVFGVLMQLVKKKQRMAKLLRKAEDDFFKTRSATVEIRPEDRIGMPTQRTVARHPVPVGYGATSPGGAQFQLSGPGGPWQMGQAPPAAWGAPPAGPGIAMMPQMPNTPQVMPMSTLPGSPRSGIRAAPFA